MAVYRAYTFLEKKNSLSTMTKLFGKPMSDQIIFSSGQLKLRLG